MQNHFKSFMKKFFRLPTDAFILSSKRLPDIIQRKIDEDITISSRYIPYLPGQGAYSIPQKVSDLSEVDEDGLPIPPKELWLNYGQTASEYLDMGSRHVDKMEKIVMDAGFSLKDAGRILDFGCAAGRMVRKLVYLADVCEIWGCDISAAHIIWCQQHLSPPFKFVNTTTYPHLPFEDCSFGFIYAGSVFTNIAELADAWLLELRRLLRPGGMLFLTVHDEHTRQLILKRNGDSSIAQLIRTNFQDHRLSETDLGMYVIYRTAGMTQVFHDISYIRHHWGQYMEILSVTEEAYGPQTAVLMRKKLA